MSSISKDNNPGEPMNELLYEPPMNPEMPMPFISIFGLFDDGWLSTLSWLDISGASQLSIKVFLPLVPKAESHKKVIVLCDTRYEVFSIVRGELTQMHIQPLAITNSRVGFDVVSPEFAKVGDKRQLGMKLAAIEVDGRNLTLEDLRKMQQRNDSLEVV